MEKLLEMADLVLQELNNMDLEKINYSKYLDKDKINFLLPVYLETTDEDFDFDSPFNCIYINISGKLEININSLVKKVKEDIDSFDSTKEEYTYYYFRDFFYNIFYTDRTEEYSFVSTDLQALYKCIIERI